MSGSWRALSTRSIPPGRAKNLQATMRAGSAPEREGPEPCTGAISCPLIPPSPGSLSCRERLRSKFLRLIVRVGGHWEQHLQWQKAVEVFQKGLEVDGLAEEFYQHLMLCYHRNGSARRSIVRLQPLPHPLDLVPRHPAFPQNRRPLPDDKDLTAKPCPSSNSSFAFSDDRHFAHAGRSRFVRLIQ